MSNDLNFWKYKDSSISDHQKVYEALSDGQEVGGLEILPIEDILKRVNEVFTEQWNKLSELDWESENGAFQIFTTSQFFRVDCYGMSGDDMNMLIDIGLEFGCPLFDPQVGQRFDSQMPN